MKNAISKIVVGAVGACVLSVSAKTVTWPLPSQTVTNGYCQVTVDGKKLDVFALPKPPKSEKYKFYREGDLNPYGAVFFDSDREVEVVAAFPNGRTERFRAKPPFTRVVENGGRHGALIVCANALETNVPDRKDPKVKWFGPGLHRPERILLGDGETLYLAPGAVVESALVAKGKNVTVCGRGILSGIPWGWQKGPGKHMCHFLGENIVIRDIAIAGAWCWTLVLEDSRRVKIDNIRILGGKVLNDDGIDVCKTDDVTIRNSFIRSQDDCIAPKWWCTNLRVENCQLWTDEANAVRIGWECDPKAGAMRNLKFRGIDVHHLAMEKRPAKHVWFNSCFCIQASAKMPISDIVFEKVRIHAYEKGDILFVAFTGTCGDPAWGANYSGGGTIDNVLLKDFTLPAEAKMITRLAAEKRGQIGRIVFDNVTGYTAPELVNADAPQHCDSCCGRTP